MNDISPKILIVEDELNWVRRYTNWLGKEGFSDITAPGNLHEASGLMDDNKYDLCIVDGLGGLWRKFAEKGKELGIRMVVISAQSAEAKERFKADVASLGAEFINKDVFLDEQQRERTIKELTDSLRPKPGGEVI